MPLPLVMFFLSLLNVVGSHWTPRVPGFNGVGLLTPFAESWSTSRSARQQQARVPPNLHMQTPSTGLLTKVSWSQTKDDIVMELRLGTSFESEFHAPARGGRVELATSKITLRGAQATLEIHLASDILPGKSQWRAPTGGVGGWI